MIRRGVIRLIPALVLVSSFACAPRLDEPQVRARLVARLQLQNDLLRIVSITSDAQPVATIDYGGVGASVRFRRQDGVWVIDAVGANGTWESADQGVPTLSRQLVEKARARWLEQTMPRYARTLRLLVGWTDLVSTSATFPTSQVSLANLHAAYHRALFPNRGTEFHNLDLFERDAWMKPFKTKLTVSRIEVQSGGADGRMDTADDMRLVVVSAQRGPVTYMTPHYTMPDFVFETLGKADAPAPWNCAELLSMLKKGDQIDVVASR